MPKTASYEERAFLTENQFLLVKNKLDAVFEPNATILGAIPF